MRALLASAAALSMLWLTGCTSAVPEPNETPVHYRVCQLTQRSDTNFQADVEQLTYALQKAQITLGVHYEKASVKVSDSSTVDVFNSLLKRDCNLVATTGARLSVLAAEAAAKHPEVQFLRVAYNDADFDQAASLGNLRTITFDVNQVGFLAGYAAAASSKTGLVAAIGGTPSSRTKQYLSGFEAGVDQYNLVSSGSVVLLGKSANRWVYAETTADPKVVSELAAGYASLGVDVLFLSAGAASVGAGPIAVAEKMSLIFSDSDWWFDPAAETFRAQILTSATCSLTRVAYEALAASFENKFETLPVVFTGSLANGGTALAPEHELGFSVMASSALEQLTKDLVSGKVGN